MPPCDSGYDGTGLAVALSKLVVHPLAVVLMLSPLAPGLGTTQMALLHG